MGERFAMPAADETPKISRRRRVAIPRPVERRTDRESLLGPLATVFATLPAWRRDLVAMEGNPNFLRVLGIGTWSDGAKALAIEEFVDRMNDADGVTLLSELPERLDFWDANVPADLFGENMSFDARLLLTGSLLFLEAALETLGTEGFEAMLRDPDSARGFRALAEAIRKPDSDGFYKFEFFARKQGGVFVDWDEGQESRARELADIAETTGLMPILRLVARSIRAVEPASGCDSSGYYDTRTGDIGAGATGRGRGSLPETLFHETGHGVQEWLGQTAVGWRRYLGYAVASAVEPQTHSSYAEGFRVRGQGLLEDYVSESFAEDFRLYFFAPERLSVRKRRAVDEIVRAHFPTIDPEDVRRKTRSVLGNFYGVSVEDVLRPTNCENARREARYAERVASEDARDDGTEDNA